MMVPSERRRIPVTDSGAAFAVLVQVPVCTVVAVKVGFPLAIGPLTVPEGEDEESQPESKKIKTGKAGSKILVHNIYKSINAFRRYKF